MKTSQDNTQFCATILTDLSKANYVLILIKYFLKINADVVKALTLNISF